MAQNIETSVMTKSLKSWWSLEAVFSQDETEELHERDDVRRAHVENLGPNQTCLNTTIRYSFGVFLGGPSKLK